MVRKEYLENEPVDESNLVVPKPSEANIPEEKHKSIEELSDAELKIMGYDLVLEIDKLSAQREHLIAALQSINQELSSRTAKKQ